MNVYIEMTEGYTGQELLQVELEGPESKVQSPTSGRRAILLSPFSFFEADVQSISDSRAHQGWPDRSRVRLFI